MNIRAQNDVAETRLRWSKRHPLAIRYQPGELVYHVGSYAAGAGMLLSGVIVDFPGPASATRSEMAEPDLLGPDDLFGIEVLVSPPVEVHRTSGRALTEVEVAFVERDALHQALSEDPALGDALLAYVAARFLRLRELDRLPGPSSRDAAQVKRRLAGCLLQLAQMCGTPEDDQQRVIRLPKEVTARALSSILAVSATRIARLLSDPDLVAVKALAQPESANCDPAEGLLVAADKLARVSFLTPEPG